MPTMWSEVRGMLFISQAFFFSEFLLLVPNSYPFPTHFWENVGIPT